jgi:hypothetical protein
MLLVWSKLVELSYVNKKPWRNKMWGLLWIPLWQLYNLLVYDLYKRESLGTCDEWMPLGCCSHIKIRL